MLHNLQLGTLAEWVALLPVAVACFKKQEDSYAQKVLHIATLVAGAACLQKKSRLALI